MRVLVIVEMGIQTDSRLKETALCMYSMIPGGMCYGSHGAFRYLAGLNTDK